MHLFLALLLVFIPVGSTIFTEARTTNGDADFTTDARFAMKKVLLNRRRREVHTIATQPCYTAFFVGNLPPNGFRANYANIRYICQQLPGDLKPIKTTYYSSMFDVSYGITIFSAYVVKAADASKIGTSSRQGLKWRTEPGLPLQGSDGIYAGKKTYAKGHLAPADIYSFSPENLNSTFRYTNAVPQKRAFNSGLWANYEGLIVNYAQTTCSAGLGDLYLITGVSEANYENDGLPVAILATQENLGSKGNAVRVPRSMWTAGCCVVPASGAVLSNFAVIGNNVADTKKIKLVELAVPDLEKFILAGLGLSGGPSVALFPGNAQCSDIKKRVILSRKRPADTAPASGPSKKPVKPWLS